MKTFYTQLTKNRKTQTVNLNSKNTFKISHKDLYPPPQLIMMSNYSPGTYSQMCFDSLSILATAMSKWTNSVANLFGNHYTVYWQTLYIGNCCILAATVLWKLLYIGKHCILATTV